MTNNVLNGMKINVVNGMTNYDANGMKIMLLMG